MCDARYVCDTQCVCVIHETCAYDTGGVCDARYVCDTQCVCEIDGICACDTGGVCDTGCVCDARCVCTCVPNIHNTGPCIQSVTHRHPRVYINTRTHSKRTQKGFSGAVAGSGPWSW